MELKNAFIRVALTRVWEWFEATHPEKKNPPLICKLQILILILVVNTPELL